jgi:hypothetical protein
MLFETPLTDCSSKLRSTEPCVQQSMQCIYVLTYVLLLCSDFIYSCACFYGPSMVHGTWFLVHGNRQRSFPELLRIMVALSHCPVLPPHVSVTCLPQFRFRCWASYTSTSRQPLPTVSSHARRQCLWSPRFFCGWSRTTRHEEPQPAALIPQAAVTCGMLL